MNPIPKSPSPPPEKPGSVVPGKLNLLSRWPGEGLGGVVALDGLEDVGKGAGEEGVEDVVEDGLLLESRWFMAGGCSCKARHGEWAGTVTALPGCLPCPQPGPSLPRVNAKGSAQGTLTFPDKDVRSSFQGPNRHLAPLCTGAPGRPGNHRGGHSLRESV